MVHNRWRRIAVDRPIVAPIVVLWSIVVTSLCGGCRPADVSPGRESNATSPTVGDDSPSRQVLRLAVTTSTRDSGLLDALLPVFERQANARVDVIAAGTGKALKLGSSGDVDIVLVHARAAEDEFMAAGHGVRREDVMYNTFEIVGPSSDPAGVARLTPQEALQRIADTGHRFVSRGDESGTHQRELQLWRAGGSRPAWDSYLESGQGMGPTLIMADQMQAYLLTDRGTYLAMRDKIDLVPLVAQTDDLKNPYGVLVVNPDGSPGINERLAQRLADFFIAPATQAMIGRFQVAGEPLFYPAHPISAVAVGDDR